MESTAAEGIVISSTNELSSNWVYLKKQRDNIPFLQLLYKRLGKSAYQYDYVWFNYT